MSEFEIAIGGLTSIPVVGGLIFLGYKSLGESSLDTSKLKPKKKTAVAEGTPTPEKRPWQKAKRQIKILIRLPQLRKSLCGRTAKAS